MTIETQFDGGRELRVQYSRLFKYARTDVGDACNVSTGLDEETEVVANIMSSAGKKWMAITTFLLADVLSIRMLSLEGYLAYHPLVKRS